MNKEKLPDEQVNVKLSICGKCSKIVRVAVSHMMDRKSINEFEKEVMIYNLLVKEQSLVQYQKTNAKWCGCE